MDEKTKVENRDTYQCEVGQGLQGKETFLLLFLLLDTTAATCELCACCAAATVDPP